MNTLQHKFMFGETVLIKALDIEGVVTHILFTYCGLEYKVRYFTDENVPYEIYFYEPELKAIKKANPLKEV